MSAAALDTDLKTTLEHPAAGASPLQRLRERIAQEDQLIVAFSGGVDSALVAVTAAEVLGDKALAVTAVSPSLPEQERAAARNLMKAHGVKHIEVATDEFERPEYVKNAGDRCFHCKSALFDAIAPLSDLLGAPVALGTNLDDLGDHRPGLAAAKLRGSLAPMVDAGLSKPEVREAAADLGLEVAAKPAAACLSSRIAYGDPVTPEAVRAVELAERELHRMGLVRVRVRSHAKGTVARVEVPEDQLAEAIDRRGDMVAAVKDAGFLFVTLDLDGLLSGSMNRLLPVVEVR